MMVEYNMRQTYPRLSAWIYDRLHGVPENGRVWRAFLKYSELGALDARRALQTCSATPIIDFAEMPGANGRFNGGRDPDRVFLAKAICDKFENSATDRRDARMHLLVESTILHELVHWGDHKDGRDQEGEEGKAFEREAYGRDINRYW